jgi:hypothetical protein
MVFQPVPVLGTPVVQVIKQQHSAMYATQAGPSRGGVLRCAGDFFKLFNFGIRGGESRFFTYTLCSDCFRLVTAPRSQQRKQLHCAHATAPQRTAGYQKQRSQQTPYSSSSTSWVFHCTNVAGIIVLIGLYSVDLLCCSQQL